VRRFRPIEDYARNQWVDGREQQAKDSCAPSIAGGRSVADPPPIVCLSFDFDQMSSRIFRGDITPTPLSRGEYGARVGMPRVLDLLDREEIPATFFVPGHSADTFPALVERAVRSGHELGHHGWLHEVPATLTEEQERSVLERGIASLQRISDLTPAGYRSPSWDLSPHSIRLLREFGFRYDSSLMADDFSLYWCREGDVAHTDRAFEFGRETDLVEMPISWLLDDFPLFEYDQRTRTGMAPASRVEEIWRDEFDFMADRVPGGVYTLTMHPQVIGRGHRMLMLERLIRHMRGRGAVFRRMGDVAEEWRARNRRKNEPAGAAHQH
jgi:peptidoglycan/xylan/chitin deacetylase (PgdA/CDA1 family)